MSEGKVSISYLISRYPDVSHTFILREVLHLKSLGFDMKIASINEAGQAANGFTAEEQTEAAHTYYVKRDGLTGALKNTLSTFLSSPLSCLGGLIYALRLARLDPTKLVYNFFYFIEAAMVGQWMRRNRHTHLHVHFANPASTVGLIAKKTFPITFSLIVHGQGEFKDSFLPEKIRNAAFICCVGNFARGQLMAASAPSDWTKFEVTPLGVDPEKFAPRPLRVDPNIFEIVSVGRLVRGKGQYVLLEAFELLLEEGRQVRLHLVGEGPERTSLEKAAGAKIFKEAVLFAGAVNQDLICDLYSTADAFVLASFAEGIPVVLMEAMAMEIPCVSTCVGGIAELIRNGVDGLLVAPSDPSALKNAIASLIDDPSLRLRLGRSGRLRVIDKYNLKPNMNRLAEVFVRRLSEGRSKVVVGDNVSQDDATVESKSLSGVEC